MIKYILPLVLLTSCECDNEKVEMKQACNYPEHYEGEDEPGAGYKESQTAAEDADCHEDYASGQAYIDSFNAAFMARNLTDEEIDNADNAPGSGYHDSEKVAEDPDYWAPEDSRTEIDSEYAVEKVIEDDEGNIVIIDDDGEIYVIEPEDSVA